MSHESCVSRVVCLTSRDRLERTFSGRRVGVVDVRHASTGRSGKERPGKNGTEPNLWIVKPSTGERSHVTVELHERRSGLAQLMVGAITRRSHAHDCANPEMSPTSSHVAATLSDDTSSERVRSLLAPVPPAGHAGGVDPSPTSSPARSPLPCAPPATSPTKAWRRPRSSRSRCAGRCSARVSRARARPRSPMRWRRARRRADPAAVLRGHRRDPGALRLGLPPPAAPPARPEAAGAAQRTEDVEARGHLSTTPVPARPADAARAADLPARAARRRDRPRRRRVRGVPARGAHRARGHVPELGGRARPSRRWWCSRATAPARCTTRSSAAASTTGWTTRPSTGRSRSCTRGSPAPERLAAEVAAAAHRLREADLLKPPGVAESLDWARALQLVGARHLDATAPRPRSARC